MGVSIATESGSSSLLHSGSCVLLTEGIRNGCGELLSVDTIGGEGGSRWYGRLNSETFRMNSCRTEIRCGCEEDLQTARVWAEQ